MEKEELNAVKRLVDYDVRPGDRFPVELIGVDLVVFADSNNLELFATGEGRQFYKFKQPLIKYRGEEQFVLVTSDYGVRFYELQGVECELKSGEMKKIIKQKLKSVIPGL